MWTSRMKFVVGGTALASLVSGVVLGSVITRRFLDKKWDQRLEEEIEKTKNYYAILHKKDEYSTVEKAFNKLREQPVAVAAAQAVTVYSGLHEIATEVEQPLSGQIVGSSLTRRVFDPPNPTVSIEWQEEIRNRTEEAPYVISQDEHGSNELDYTQVTLTYYDGDKTLVDDQDNMIEDPDSVVGENNLVRFGHWSNDPKVVYVRNDIREADYEIVYDSRSFSELVLDVTQP